VSEADVPFYRVGSYSNFSSAMAPPGAGSLYVELASRDEPDLPALLPQVARHLVAMGVVRSAERIRFARARRLDPAYVVFDRAHAASVATIAAWLDRHGVRSTGRYGAWTYGGMEDAIVQGREAAAWASSWTGAVTAPS
jgi:protoporphyrinogen oxidase